jgi:hypothetical protein
VYMPDLSAACIVENEWNYRDDLSGISICISRCLLVLAAVEKGREHLLGSRGFETPPVVRWGPVGTSAVDRGCGGGGDRCCWEGGPEDKLGGEPRPAMVMMIRLGWCWKEEESRAATRFTFDI